MRDIAFDIIKDLLHRTRVLEEVVRSTVTSVYVSPRKISTIELDVKSNPDGAKKDRVPGIRGEREGGGSGFHMSGSRSRAKVA